MLSSYMVESNDHNKWVKHIPKVQCKCVLLKIMLQLRTYVRVFILYYTVAMNTQHQETIQAIPYEVVFGISPSSEPVPELYIMDEQG